MKKNLLFVALLFVGSSFFISKSTAQNHFEKSIGTTQHNKVGGAISTANAYYLAGSQIETSNNKDIWVMKLDKTANTIWSYKFESSGNEESFAISGTHEGGIAIAGYTTGFTTIEMGNSSIFVAKLDTIGNIIWSAIYGGLGTDIAYSLKQTRDSGFVICGSTSSFGNGGNDVYVFKIDKDGNLLWDMAFGTSMNEKGNAVIELADGSFCITGNSDGISNNTQNFLLKISSTGQFVWAKQYEMTSGQSSKKEYGFDLIQDNGGAILFCGGTYSTVMSDGAPYLVKTDSAGNLIWGYSYTLNSGECAATKLYQTTDNGYVLGANMYDGYFSILRTDHVGQRTWNTIYKETDFTKSKTTAIIHEEFNDIFLVGNFVKGGDTAAYVFKSDSIGDFCKLHGVSPGTGTNNPSTSESVANFIAYTGGNLSSSISLTRTQTYPTVYSYCTNVGIGESIPGADLLISPNPAEEFAVISKSNETESNNATLELYNSLGMLVAKFENISEKYFIINRNDLPAGLYLIKWMEKNCTPITKKLIFSN